MGSESPDIEALFREHAGAVLAYARRRIDPATADEVVGDVFVVALRRPHAIPAEPRPWLLGVARRVLSNHRRYSARQAALYSKLAAEMGAAIPGEPAGDSNGAVLKALASLRESDREVLLLVGWDGLTPAEGAAVLGISPTSFSTRLHRARARLTEELGPGAATPTLRRSSTVKEGV